MITTYRLNPLVHNLRWNTNKNILSLIKNSNLEKTTIVSPRMVHAILWEPFFGLGVCITNKYHLSYNKTSRVQVFADNNIEHKRLICVGRYPAAKYFKLNSPTIPYFWNLIDICMSDKNVLCIEQKVVMQVLWLCTIAIFVFQFPLFGTCPNRLCGEIR